MLLLQIDERSREPKSRQIITQIRTMIDHGSLRAGELLPSTRKLAEVLVVNRSTVALAYQELWALGYIDLAPGARPRVRRRVPLADRKDEAANIIDWDETASPASNEILTTFRNWRAPVNRVGEPGVIDFGSLDVDPRLAPDEVFRTCLNTVLKDQGANLLGYADPTGYQPLRDYVAKRLHSHGISVAADEILITNGAQHALDLVFRMVAAQGRKVVVEAPTYDCVLPLLRFNGLEPVEIPMRRDGMDLDALALALQEEKPVLVYTMPSFQNPTGISTGQAHRERLLRLCEQHRVPIIEDAFDEEMKYFGRVVLPVKSMDQHQSVIYCGTFSKVLFPGVRIGWVAAGRECVARLTALRRFSELSANVLLQAAISKFCADGHYDRHISRMHRAFRRRMQVLNRELRDKIRPEWATWVEPNGGYLAWLELKPTAGPAPDWNGVLSAHGIKAAFGKGFFASEQPGTYIRLSIASLGEDEIAEGVARLARALGEAHREGNHQ